MSFTQEYNEEAMGISLQTYRPVYERSRTDAVLYGVKFIPRAIDMQFPCGVFERERIKYHRCPGF
jgi:hypothetical protein